MEALLTSCGRFDLLQETLKSLFENQQQKISLTINEDCLDSSLSNEITGFYRRANFKVNQTLGNGQHHSIERFIADNHNLKYYLHLEDDWNFKNSYDWIKKSIEIMESDPTIIKVLARHGSPHPCVHDKELNGIKYGYLQPWKGNDGILWHGFSWNPGVTRMDLLKKFIPFQKYEQELAEKVYNKGYKVVELKKGVYTHIGNDRSTH